MSGIAATTSAVPNQRSGGADDPTMAGIVGPSPRSGRYDQNVPPIDLHRSAENLRLERDALALYESLARIERDPIRAEAFREIASNERRHAEIWAEKLRKQIAGQVINAGSRSLSVTVSMGIGGLMEGMKMEELASDTDKVLTKAMEHGGNLVRVH